MIVSNSEQFRRVFLMSETFFLNWEYAILLVRSNLSDTKAPSEFETPKIPKIWDSHSSKFIFCLGSSFSDTASIEAFGLILKSFSCKEVKNRVFDQNGEIFARI